MVSSAQVTHQEQPLLAARPGTTEVAYLWEINASDIDGGGSIGTDPGWDWLDITGTLDLANLSAGGFTIDIDSLTSGNIAGDAVGFDTWTKGNPGDVDYSFIIASASGGITDFSADKFSFDSSGFTNGPSWDWQIKLSGTDLVLEAYAVPEPSSDSSARTRRTRPHATPQAQLIPDEGSAIAAKRPTKNEELRTKNFQKPPPFNTAGFFIIHLILSVRPRQPHRGYHSLFTIQNSPFRRRHPTSASGTLKNEGILFKEIML